MSLLPQAAASMGRSPLVTAPAERESIASLSPVGFDLELHREIVFLVGICLFLVLFRPRRVQPILTLPKVILLVLRGTSISLWDNSWRLLCAGSAVQLLVCVACAGVVLRNIEVILPKNKKYILNYIDILNVPGSICCWLQAQASLVALKYLDAYGRRSSNLAEKSIRKLNVFKQN